MRWPPTPVGTNTHPGTSGFPNTSALWIFDDFLLLPTSPAEQQDLLILLRARDEDHSSTILCSQVSLEGWHKHLGSGGVADTLLDRITSNGYDVVLRDRLFVWDKPKNEANKQIHGIDFYTAIYIFNDDDRLEDDNQVVDGELREQAIGEPEGPIVKGHPINTKHSRPKAIIGEVEGVLFVVFTMEEGTNWKATRIISARVADEDEVKAYFDWKYGSGEIQ